MRVLLVRHGETDWNASRRYQGNEPVALNAHGHAQAQAVAARLARSGAVALYTSPLIRAAETARHIAATTGLAPRALADLREIDVGQWQGLTPEELHAQFPAHMAEVARDPANTVRLGGESYAQLQQRALRTLEAIHAQHAADDTVIVVSHGGTIRTYICAFIGLDLRLFGNLWVDNGALCELRYRRDGWRVVSYNDAAHLAGGRFATGE